MYSVMRVCMLAQCSECPVRLCIILRSFIHHPLSTLSSFIEVRGQLYNYNLHKLDMTAYANGIEHLDVCT